MNVVLLISSLVMLGIGLFAILRRQALWDAHVRRSQVLGRNPGDVAVWSRNLLYGGVFFLILAALGLIAAFTSTSA